MRKLISVLCVVALMLIMAVPAFANPSVSSTVTVLTEGVVIAPPVINDITDETVKNVVETVNGEGYLTPADVVRMVLGEDAEEMQEVIDYSFSSQFNTIDAPEFPVDVEFEGTDENTKIMLINPETEELLVILKPNPDGTFTFPFGGLFALIDPTP